MLGIHFSYLVLLKFYCEFILVVVSLVIGSSVGGLRSCHLLSVLICKWLFVLSLSVVTQISIAIQVMTVFYVVIQSDVEPAYLRNK